MKYLIFAVLVYALCFKIALADDSIAPGKIYDRNGILLVGNDTEGGETKRSYPFGAAAAHLIGAPFNGIPSAYKEQLTRGEDVTLTIDIRVQLAAEMAMRRVGRGAAVVTDPSTGEILAMVSIPSFDPESFNPRITKEKFDELQNDPSMPMLDRTGKSYSPGSPFKIVTALTPLAKKDGAETLGVDRCDCRGGIEIDGRPFRCWKKAGHGLVDLPTAVSQSCNVFFYQRAEAVGMKEIARVGKLLGFGSKQGLPSYESEGFLPSPLEFEKVHKRPWTNTDTATIGIGQGYLAASPVQMVGMIGAVATGGTYRKLHLVAE